jgi:hypothetical protein
MDLSPTGPVPLVAVSWERSLWRWSAGALGLPRLYLRIFLLQRETRT